VSENRGIYGMRSKQTQKWRGHDMKVRVYIRENFLLCAFSYCLNAFQCSALLILFN